MPSSKKLRKQLLQMWDENPHCHWCGRLTTLEREIKETLTPEAATIDHLYSRSDPRRKEINRTMEKRRLLACYECNQQRNYNEIVNLNAEKTRRQKLSALGIQTNFD